jgi:hypothetical protein
MDTEGEGSPERSGEGSWLTYDEIGRMRGIGRESAVKLVQRRRWRRLPGNDGIARVLVPPEWLKAIPQDREMPSGDHSPQPSPDISSAISALEAAIAGLVVRAERAEADADRERIRADRAEAGRDGERARADMLRDRIDAMQAEAATLQARIETLEGEGAASDVETAELTAQVNQARAEIQAAEQAADDLRQVDEARRSLGLLARLRAAWRGQ